MRFCTVWYLALLGLSTAIPTQITKRQDSGTSTTDTSTSTSASQTTSTQTTASSQSSDSSQPTQVPLLKLDYATYQPAIFNSDADIYTYKNIRYAAPPTGDLRWKKPQPPENVAAIQDGSLGYSCIQTQTQSTPQSEDCLFLDVYVPGKAARNPSSYSLPVVVWIHGGSNTVGSKNAQDLYYYNGTGPVQQSNNNIIFVSINYRLGAFGWLAGDTMEKNGLPNAGLHDQRAAFRWVQSYIGQVGGDKTQVTAWGESAGASNLFHHLIAQGGTLDPLFSRALLMSPASVTVGDRLGMLEECYQSFKSLANCSTGGLACLQAASTDVLQAASSAWGTSLSHVCGNIAADGTFIRQPATIEYRTGNYWKGLQSILVTHVRNEPDIFVPSSLSSDADVQRYLTAYYPANATSMGIIDAIMKYYPSPSVSTTYKTQSARVSAWIRDSSFANRVRSLASAYASKVWIAQYSVPSRPNVLQSYHGTDCVAMFWNKYLPEGTTRMGSFAIPSNIQAVSATYNSYMLSHAMTGDPNKNANTNASTYAAIAWPQPGGITAEKLTGVLNFGSQSVTTVVDDQELKSRTDFNAQVVIALTNAGGYAVPGTVQTSKVAGLKVTKALKLTMAQPSASRNYVDQCVQCRET